jgi:tetratricopeptide (TPR) repeat protein
MLDLVRGGDFDAVDSHVDNVRAAVTFATAHDAGLLDAPVVGVLADYLRQRGRFAEAHRTLTGIADATDDPATRSIALLHAGIAANLRGDPRAALDLAGRATADAVAGHRLAVLNLIGSAHKALGDLDAAQRTYAECLDAATAAGDTRYVTVALNNLGTVAHDRGTYEQAREHYERSLAIKREAGDVRGVATARLNLGGLHNDLGEYEPARRHLVAAIRLTRQLSDPYSTAFALSLLAESEAGLAESGAGLAESEAGGAELAAARRSADEALAIADEIDSPRVRALAAMALGDIARRHGADDVAADRFRAALADVSEPYERARVLERLAAVADDDEAPTMLAEADEIRRTLRYAIPPVDRPLAERTRRRLARRRLDPNTRATGDERPSRLGASVRSS